MGGRGAGSRNPPIPSSPEAIFLVNACWELRELQNSHDTSRNTRESRVKTMEPAPEKGGRFFYSRVRLNFHHRAEESVFVLARNTRFPYSPKRPDSYSRRRLDFQYSRNWMGVAWMPKNALYGSLFTRAAP